MFEQELVRLMDEYRRYEEMTNPFKYYQGKEENPYIEMKKRQYNSQFMKDIRFKEFLSHPYYKPLIERLKKSVLDDLQPELEKGIEETLNKVIDEINLGKKWNRYYNNYRIKN